METIDVARFVQISKDIEKEIIDRRIERVRVTNSIIDCDIEISHNYLDQDVVANAVYMINGKKYTSVEKIPSYEQDGSNEKLIKKLFLKISEKISVIIIEEGLNEFKRRNSNIK